MSDIILRKIKGFIKNSGEKQKHIAQKLDLSEAAFSSRLKNKLSLDFYLELCKVLNVSASFFIDDKAINELLTKQKEADYKAEIAELKKEVRALVERVNELEKNEHIKKIEAENKYLWDLTGLQKKNTDLESEINKLKAEIIELEVTKKI